QTPLRGRVTVEREPRGPQCRQLRRGGGEQTVADETELAREGEGAGPALGIGLLLAALGALPGPSPAQHAPAVGVEDGLRGVKVRAEVHPAASRGLEARRAVLGVDEIADQVVDLDGGDVGTI